MRASLDTLSEPFRHLALDLAKRILVENLPFFLFEGLRTFERQNALYRQGRSWQNGVWVVEDKDKIFTNAKAGESPHNWGLAADFVLDINSSLWSKQKKPKSAWDTGFENGETVNTDVALAWERFGAQANAVGLEWGGKWKFRDLPHVQLVGWKSFRPVDWQTIVKTSLVKQS